MGCSREHWQRSQVRGRISLLELNAFDEDWDRAPVPSGPGVIDMYTTGQTRFASITNGGKA